MGLRVDIYRTDRADCSNGGLSGRVAQVTLVNVEGPSKPTADAPPCELINGNLGTVICVPIDRPLGRVGPMMGGTYVATSDSRFGEKVRELGGAYGAVAFHDRFETPAQYEALSR